MLALSLTQPELLWRRRELVLEMTRRDVVDRYAGQVLGSSWAIIAPLLTMATYMLAFGVIFRSRIGPDDNGTGYVAFALAGLVPWMGLQDCLSRATMAIVGNGNLVKQIVFPSNSAAESRSRDIAGPDHRPARHDRRFCNGRAPRRVRPVGASADSAGLLYSIACRTKLPARGDWRIRARH